jgi:hypothetical protein
VITENRNGSSSTLTTVRPANLDAPATLAAPAIGPDLAPAAQLNLRLDVARLTGDLERISGSTWTLQRSFADDGSIVEATVDWRCRPLRSVAGDPERTDPGGPGLDGYADTPWLRATPYLAEVLSAIPAPLRSARLLALGPGAASWEHNDTKYGPAWGLARLHVPITTTPGAVLYMEGVAHRWQPGTLWFADFSRMHRVENTDHATRVHLVIDALMSDGLLDLFPAGYRDRMVAAGVLVNRPAQPLTPAEAEQFRCRFTLPPAFLNWEDEGESFEQQQRFDAVIESNGTRVFLMRDGRPLVALVHIGGGEFRFAGWTDERTLLIDLAHERPSVTMRIRCGTAMREQAGAAELL